MQIIKMRATSLFYKQFCPAGVIMSILINYVKRLFAQNGSENPYIPR